MWRIPGGRVVGERWGCVEWSWKSGQRVSNGDTGVKEVGVVTSNDGTEVMESGAACRESYTRS